jgi:pyruvate,phosphate dikinase
MFELYPFGIKEVSTEHTKFSELQDEAIAKALLGGKGAGLHWLTSVGVPVPAGFVIPTTAWTEYKQKPATTMKIIKKAVQPYLDAMEKQFGYMPLLSVRSGARVSCPGMMDTILNVGIEGKTASFWSGKLGDACYEDSLHRLITMYGSVVKGIERKELEEGTVESALAVYKRVTSEDFPDASGQLLGAIEAVFKSWDNERAKVYRKMHGYEDAWGTAVTIQAMVFGNLNEQSGTGVLFTRNPDTGENVVTGEFMQQAQGEDLVAGIRTPLPLSKMTEWNSKVAIDLMEMVVKLEKLKKDVQDIEFTVQDGLLYLLQTRNAKRTPQASLKIVLDMLTEGLISEEDAVERITAKDLDLALVARIDPKLKKAADFTGLSGCSGAVCGKPVFSSTDAIKSKVPCILITQETTPDDIAGMAAAVGIITMTGGSTCHAAVVARGMNKPCITGVGAPLEMFKVATVGMDGATGRVWLSAVPVMSGASADVTSFHKLLIKRNSVVPIIFETPKFPMDEALLYLGGKIMDWEASALLVDATSKMVKKLYVDMSAGGTAEEKTFFSMFAKHDATKKLTAELEQLHFSNEVVLVGSASKKFKSIGTTESLEAAVLATDAISVTGENLTPAMEKVLEWKKQEGVGIISVGSQVKGAKSMVSVETLLAK